MFISVTFCILSFCTLPSFRRKNPHRIFCKLPVDNFPHSAIRKIPIPTSRSDPAKHCWIFQERRTLHVTTVPGTPLQCILQCRESPLPWGATGCQFSFIQHFCTSCSTFITCTCSMNQPLFLQDHTITTCARVFISLKLVQYLSRTSGKRSRYWKSNSESVYTEQLMLEKS